MPNYEVTHKGIHGKDGAKIAVGTVIELDKIPSHMIGKVRLQSTAKKTGDSGEVKALKAENEALKAEIENLKSAPALELEAATPKPAAKASK